MSVIVLLLWFLYEYMCVCVSIYPGGNPDLIGGFADFSSPAASASLPTPTGKLS